MRDTARGGQSTLGICRCFWKPGFLVTTGLQTGRYNLGKKNFLCFSSAFGLLWIARNSLEKKNFVLRKLSAAYKTCVDVSAFKIGHV